MWTGLLGKDSFYPYFSHSNIGRYEIDFFKMINVRKQSKLQNQLDEEKWTIVRLNYVKKGLI